MKPEGLHILLGELRQCICIFCGYCLITYGVLVQYEYLAPDSDTSSRTLVVLVDIFLFARPNCAVQFMEGKENMFLHRLSPIEFYGFTSRIDF